MWGFGLIEAFAGAALSVVANLVYFEMKRKGTRGFGRFLAFWFGTPFSWATFFLVEEGQSPEIIPPPDDEASLLAEVRRDRAKRIVADTQKQVDPVQESSEEGQ
jgi:hypothetical protein